MKEKQYLFIRKALLIVLMVLGAIQLFSSSLLLLKSKDMYYIHGIILGILWIISSLVIWNADKRSTFKTFCIWTIFVICAIGAGLCVCNFPNFGEDASSAAADTFGYTIIILDLVLLS